MGYVVDEYYPEPDAKYTVIDRVSRVRVTLAHGTLASVTDAEFLNGANTAKIGLEVVLFRDATLVEPGIYELAHLIRGAYGTEQWMDHSQVDIIGYRERFILLDANVPAYTSAAELIRDRYGVLVSSLWINAATLGYTLTNESPLEIEEINQYQKSPPPAHLSAVDNGDGTYTVSWIPRVKYNGEWADNEDVDLTGIVGYAIEVYSYSTPVSATTVDGADITSATVTADPYMTVKISTRTGQADAVTGVPIGHVTIGYPAELLLE